MIKFILFLLIIMFSTQIFAVDISVMKGRFTYSRFDDDDNYHAGSVVIDTKDDQLSVHFSTTSGTVWKNDVVGETFILNCTKKLRCRGRVVGSYDNRFIEILYKNPNKIRFKTITFHYNDKIHLKRDTDYVPIPDIEDEPSDEQLSENNWQVSHSVNMDGIMTAKATNQNDEREWLYLTCTAPSEEIKMSVDLNDLNAIRAIEYTIFSLEEELLIELEIFDTTFQFNQWEVKGEEKVVSRVKKLYPLEESLLKHAKYAGIGIYSVFHNTISDIKYINFALLGAGKAINEIKKLCREGKK